MINFAKWFFLNSWFHLLILSACYIITLTWNWDTDKQISLSFLSVVFIVLFVGKYRYWKKNVKNYKFN
jgi:hypothetical protein